MAKEKIKEITCTEDITAWFRDNSDYTSHMFLGKWNTRNTEEYFKTIKDSNKVEFCITLNGVEMSKGDMEDVLTDFMERTIKPMEEKMTLFNEAVASKAHEIIKAQLGNIVDLAHEVEDKLHDMDIVVTKALED